MIKPNFIFTKYYNHFNVYVKNLENLSVEQIQEIEDFVEKRYGFFNFETYSFQVQKRLDFDDFVTLMKISGFEADFKEKFLKKKVKERI
ncbi:MAG: hypothetical protein U9P38_07710, partial [Campylobacterota bacterium]|nr:hypothetical protein [Campylobacterota bacterium]